MKTLKMVKIFLRLKKEEIVHNIKNHWISIVVGFIVGIGISILIDIFSILRYIIFPIAFLLGGLMLFFVIIDNWQKTKKEMEDK